MHPAHSPQAPYFFIPLSFARVCRLGTDAADSAGADRLTTGRAGLAHGRFFWEGAPPPSELCRASKCRGEGGREALYRISEGPDLLILTSSLQETPSGQPTAGDY